MLLHDHAAGGVDEHVVAVLVLAGVDRYDEGKLSAKYVQRVLTGTSPRDMPVEQFSRFELGINLQTAKKLGITIPQAVLFRADKLVE